MTDYIEKNKATIQRWIEAGWQWGQPIDHDTFIRAQHGDVNLVLTPTVPVPMNWFGDLSGKTVLGLAAGGGQQGPLLTAMGAQVTIIDFSPQQLASEQLVAEREGYQITMIQADITQPLPFANNSFDMIVHPVSNVYMQDVRPIWQEAARILKPGGTILSGLDNGVNFMVDNQEERIVNQFPFNPLIHPEQMAQLAADDSGVQFSHTLEDQIGGQLAAGLRLLDVYEDTNGSGRLENLHIPTFFATRSLKPA
ncbi:class I SAM-dependent methyltransferase [Lacticaseibacillus brantae]|uniref:Methyltransferase domain protein n=1 Tax=Lacticaseibacillus brantae DSM 23927 TaxID=1423727 RepID=A0A0R2B0D6_9LACO|nr:class I SAM-dependent methyltransferase [Lacticaseibacillus brantae]KRM72242.1 methyltransferase domain protein [Lacticaseibacillus brantae DSM 23927]